MSDSPGNPVAPLLPDLAIIEAEHSKWLKSEGKEGKRANLRGLDFSNADLSGRQFMEASLRGAILNGANLSKTDLRAADLSEAQLDGANLSGALLAGASLVRAKLRKANATGADMVTANFTAASAEESVVAGAKLNAAIFRDANFRRAGFSGASLRDANIRGAMLDDADLTSADLTGADCRDAGFDRVRFTNAILTNANFRGAKFGDVDMKATDFSVAIDVPAEVMAHAVQEERNKFIEEEAKIKKARAEIDKRETALAADIARAKEDEAKFGAAQASLKTKLKAYSLGFIVRGVLWLCFAGGILGFTIYVATKTEHLRSGTFAGFVGGALFAMALAVHSMVRSIQIARLIATFNADSVPEKIEEEAVGGGPVFSTPPDAPSPKTKKGGGFGKRK